MSMESQYLRVHDGYSSAWHRSLGEPRGAIYSQDERANNLIVVVGIILLFMLAFFVVNTHCGYGPSSPSETSDGRPADPQRRKEMESKLFSDKVASTLHASKSDGSSAMVFQQRQPTKDEDCPICCNDFSPNEDYCIVKSCNHLFHKACIEQWIIDREKDVCPVCRSKVIAGDECKEIEMVSSQENDHTSAT